MTIHARNGRNRWILSLDNWSADGHTHLILAKSRVWQHRITPKHIILGSIYGYTSYEILNFIRIRIRYWLRRSQIFFFHLLDLWKIAFRYPTLLAPQEGNRILPYFSTPAIHDYVRIDVRASERISEWDLQWRLEIRKDDPFMITNLNSLAYDQIKIEKLIYRDVQYGNEENDSG